MKKNIRVRWLDQPEDHDYPAAFSYLDLIFSDRDAQGIVAKLKRAPVRNFKAKDIFRASRLALLGAGNSHVEKDRMKLQNGEKLSPVLLVRDPVSAQVLIADGYHRICAVYSFDEDAVIPCKIV